MSTDMMKDEEDKIRRVEEMHAQGYTISQIANTVGMTKGSVRTLTKKLPKVVLKNAVVPGQLHVSVIQSGYLADDERGGVAPMIFIGRYLWSNKLYVRLVYRVTDNLWIRLLSDCFQKFGVPQELIYDTDDIKYKYPDITYADSDKFREEQLWFCDPLGMKKPRLTPSLNKQKKEMARLADMIDKEAFPWIEKVYGRAKNQIELDEHLPDWLESYEYLGNNYVAYIGDEKFEGNARELYEVERKHMQLVNLEDGSFIVSIREANLLYPFMFEGRIFKIQLPEKLLHSDFTLSFLSTGHYQFLEHKGNTTLEGRVDPSLFEDGGWGKSEDSLYVTVYKRN